MASLYGDLPPPETKSKGSKDNDHSNTNTTTSQGSTKISKLYNFTPQVKSTVKSLKKPIIPASWTTATQFKPTQRKPVTKPKTTIKSSTTTPTATTNAHSLKLHSSNSNENIPVPTIISTEIITKKKDTVIDNKIIEAKQNSWLQSSVTSKKRKQNTSNNKKSMGMNDTYDPKYPNEYEVYKREKKMRKRMEKERQELERKMEKERRHQRHHSHHHSHHDSPQVPPNIPPPTMPSQAPVPQNRDITGEEAYLMRARLSAKPAQPPPQMLQPNLQNIPSRVVLLTNLVGAGEVDDTLQEETAEECKKYGEVENCFIYEVKGNIPDDEAVRIFIKFSKIEEAMKAFSALNGRFFGGRTVKAKYFDEERFKKYDFAPKPGEI